MGETGKNKTDILKRYNVKAKSTQDRRHVLFCTADGCYTRTRAVVLPSPDWTENWTLLLTMFNILALNKISNSDGTENTL